LISAIRDDRDARVVLAWTPEQTHMILPEEVPGTTEAVLAARKRFTADDLLDSWDKLRWFGLLFGGLALYMFYQGWSRVTGDTDVAGRLGFAARTVANSMSVGITLLMFVIFAFIPWYQARKRMREIDHWTAENVASVVPALRFETWLKAQKAPVTRLLLGLIALVGLAQLFPGDSVQSAGLVKPAYHAGQWWRLLTAPFLHGNLIHFLLNAAALLYLGKRVEVFARWPHLPMVFLFSACVGGELSARFVPSTSVGASGGLMGLLGFLLVFESLHSRLVPRSARRRLLAGVLLTALIGLVGYRFIDNAAHAGGLIAGMLYAIVVFPKSASSYRPNATISDRVAGVGALVLLILSALFTVFRIAIL
jgi:membrane associated rhomboid family serine protease